MQTQQSGKSLSLDKTSRMLCLFVNNTVRNLFVIGVKNSFPITENYFSICIFYNTFFITFSIKTLCFGGVLIHNKIESRRRHFIYTPCLHTCVGCFHSGTLLFFSIEHAYIFASFSLLCIKASLSNVKSPFIFSFYLNINMQN